MDKQNNKKRERDNEINKKLLLEGWTVIRFWGNDIKKYTDECVKVVEKTVANLVETSLRYPVLIKHMRKNNES